MEPARPEPFSRFFLLFFSKLFGLLPDRFGDALLAGPTRLLYWQGRARRSSVLQDFSDNVNPTAPLASRNWRPVRQMYRTLVRNSVDTIWFLAAPDAVALRRFRIADRSPLDAALDAGKTTGVGAIVAFPHLGSYAALPILLASNGLPTTMVFNRQPALMQWVLTRSSQKAGLELIQVDREGGGSILTSMSDAIRRGRIVVIAGDYFRAREGGSDGIEVDLAGMKRTVGAGPAVLAVRTGAQIVPGVVFQRKHHREPVFGQPVLAAESHDGTEADLRDAVQVTSQRIADALAEFIKQEPEQWLISGGLVSDSLGRRVKTAAS